MDLETILKIKAEKEQKPEYTVKPIRQTDPTTGKEQIYKPEPRSL